MQRNIFPLLFSHHEKVKVFLFDVLWKIHLFMALDLLCLHNASNQLNKPAGPVSTY